MTKAPMPAALDKLKAQLAQLDALVAEGTLSAEAAQASRAELEKQILAAVLGPGSGTTEADTPVRVPRRLASWVTGFVLVFGAAGYAVKGHHSAWNVGPGEGPASVASGSTPVSEAEQQAQIQAMVSQLEGKLKDQPEDSEGWRMLARSYGVLGRFPDAVQAHQRVVALLPQDAQALADLADAMAMANGKTLEGEPEKLILKAVKLDPNNVKALALAGTVAYNHSDYKTAVAYWERATQVADPATGYAQQLAGALSDARQRAGLPPAGAASGAAAATAPMAAASAARISGRVTLKPELKGQVGPDDTVFIFARAPSGSRMPLAILKRKVSDLPLDFELDDSLAMSPAARLSSAQQVVVGARISKSGNAMPSPGDLEVLSAPVAVGAKSLQLEISGAVK